MQPEADTARLPVAGGYAFFFGAAPPLTEAKGLGMSGPVTDEELEAMECVFSGRGIPAKVMLCPMADPSLLAGLTRRDYQPSGFENVLYRALDRFETFPTPRAIAAEWAGPDEVELCGQTLARGFVAPDEPGPEILDDRDGDAGRGDEERGGPRSRRAGRCGLATGPRRRRHARRG